MKKLLLFTFSLLCSLSLVSQVTVVSQTNISCPGMCDGAVTLSVTGGVPPYTLNMTGTGPSSCTVAPIPPFTSNTITINNLCFCFYNAFVTDATFNIVGFTSVTITSPPPIQITFSVQNVCCNGLCNGAINAFVFGGTGPYLYNWSPSGPSSGTLTGACAGTYDLCVTDANGCAKCATTQVTQPPVFSLSSTVTAASCATCCNGGVNVSGSGGTAPYSYTVFPGNMTNSSGTFSNMCAGAYSVCASDNGCCTTCIGGSIPISTGIKTLASAGDDIFIYPNPSHGTLYVRSSADLTGASFEVHDLLGKKTESGEINDLQKINLKDGVYFITIRNKDYTILSRKKIIIEK